MESLFMLPVRRARLALQEFGPFIGLLMLPGGYLLALTAWFRSYWRGNTVRT
jgi:hypothetical protein